MTELQTVTENAGLTPEQVEKAKAIAASLDLADPQAVTYYGAGVQKELSSFSDKVLEHVTMKDSGAAGEILTDLSLKLKGLDVDSLSDNKGGFISKLFRSFASKIEKFIGQYREINAYVEQISVKLEKTNHTLMKETMTLQELFDRNAGYYQELSVFIEAGEMKLKELRETVLPEMEKKAKESGDQLALQQFTDLVSAANRFEKKLYDLKLSQTISLQAAPQIRLIQSNNQVLSDKIQSSILNTIPIWKQQIIIAISLFRQNEALKLQQEVTKTTNDMLLKNAQMMKQGTLEIAKESEKGIVEIETLKKTHQDLISTLEETIRIQRDGQTQRKSAEEEMVKMKEELRAKVLAFAEEERRIG
ncbi:toxic anion resistance protein [Gorillibacterium massiliense]|uniref:toxic anion resistance protein n=1 Tax=Gorillibacterium massiliense TaxID=1280390 RepID=UPI0004B72BF9|nr:toxic anion resistance protein [Gorillibacterium massiliense]